MKRGVVWHHSAGADGVTRDWTAICRYHFEVNGWDPPCGYHLGLELVGSVYKPQLGREPHRKGAHAGVEEYNREWLGICVVGNFEVTKPSLDLLDAIEELQKQLEAAKWVGAYRLGHRDVKVTLCPGTHLYTALAQRQFWRSPSL